MTVKEKLNLMKEIEERNRQHVGEWKRKRLVRQPRFVDFVSLAIRRPEARLLNFSELWSVPSFWLETKAAGGTMLSPDAMEWDRKKVMAEKPVALLLHSGMARSVGLFNIQWRAWSSKPQDYQMENVTWMSRKERDEWLRAAQDETWKAVNSR